MKTTKQAIWNNQIIAESSETEIVEGNHYFPFESIKKEFFTLSEEESTCPIKGVASYYNIVVDRKMNEAAAWYYAHPKEAASHIKMYVAFWKGVEIN